MKRINTYSKSIFTKVNFLAALKKAKKNVRKVSNLPEAKLLHSLFSSTVLKETIQVMTYADYWF